MTGAVFVMAPSLDMDTPDTTARGYKIYRALKRMGFTGETLFQNYQYFCSLPPSSADFLLFKILQSTGSRKRPS